jgi:hypothetical protein
MLFEINTPTYQLIELDLKEPKFCQEVGTFRRYYIITEAYIVEAADGGFVYVWSPGYPCFKTILENYHHNKYAPADMGIVKDFIKEQIIYVAKLIDL